MTHENLEAFLRSVDDPVDTFRSTDTEQLYVFPEEYTNWIEEQRAVQESCILVDQSYHMCVQILKGPDAIQLMSDLATNNFDNFEEKDPPQAKNLIFCNHNGYRIGENVVFYVDKDTFVLTGAEVPQYWLAFNAESEDYDVSADVVYEREGQPPHFRFEVQGPHALDVMEELCDGSLPDIGFFKMDELSIDGVSVFALGHGMAESPGIEIFGEYKHHDTIRDKILAVGEAYDMRQIGSKAYKTGKIGSGWIPITVPAIYECDEMADFREWLPADGFSGKLSIGGSYRGDSITDYYTDPLEFNQQHLIDYEREFVGRQALKEREASTDRTKVTFVWDPEDVAEVFQSLFTPGETYKFIDLPDTASRWSWAHFDEVRKNDELVGLSKYPGYLSYEQSMLSLGVIDTAFSEPGTIVTVVWGEENSSKRKVERHVEKEITATVAPAPYIDGGRKEL